MRGGENDMIHEYRNISLTILVLGFLFYFISICSGSGMYLSSANAKVIFLLLVHKLKKCDVMQSNTIIDNINTYELNITGQTFPIKYQIIGAKLNNISTQIVNATLLVNISPILNGIITIELPRNLIDKKQGSIDDHYTILDEDQHVIPSKEIKNNAKVRTLEIHFDKTAKYINIVGNKMEVVLSTNNRQAQVYVPQVSITCLGEKPPSQSAVQIIVNVTDKFGKIQAAILYYSIGCSSISCQDADWQHKNMNLIWGTLSNGTFSTIIPVCLARKYHRQLLCKCKR